VDPIGICFHGGDESLQEAKGRKSAFVHHPRPPGRQKSARPRKKLILAREKSGAARRGREEKIGGKTREIGCDLDIRRGKGGPRSEERMGGDAITGEKKVL